VLNTDPQEEPRHRGFRPTGCERVRHGECDEEKQAAGCECVRQLEAALVSREALDKVVKP
jgi:hypothetical protein